MFEQNDAGNCWNIFLLFIFIYFIAFLTFGRNVVEKKNAFFAKRAESGRSSGHWCHFFFWSIGNFSIAKWQMCVCVLNWHLGCCVHCVCYIYLHASLCTSLYLIFRLFLKLTEISKNFDEAAREKHLLLFLLDPVSNSISISTV